MSTHSANNCYSIFHHVQLWCHCQNDVNICCSIYHKQLSCLPHRHTYFKVCIVQSYLSLDMMLRLVFPGSSLLNGAVSTPRLRIAEMKLKRYLLLVKAPLWCVFGLGFIVCYIIITIIHQQIKLKNAIYVRIWKCNISI